MGTAGSIWIKDGKYYYFDDLGDTQLVNGTVFEITDKNVLRELLSASNKISTDRIREMIAQKQMEAVSGKVQLKATVKYGMDYRIFLLFALGIVIFEIYAGNYRRKNGKQIIRTCNHIVRGYLL